MTLLWAIAAAFLALQLAVLASNALVFRRLRPTPAVPAAQRAAVSLLVPARDEAATLPATLPLLLRQGAGQVIVLDDGSTDGTGEVLARFATSPGLEIVRGAPLPPGWVGKNWACSQLARAARGSILVFTDADVSWGDGALDAVLSAMRDSGAGLVTVWPRQRTLSIVERVVVPQLDLLLLGALPEALVDRSTPAALSAASGQLMAWTREAYAAAGGHAAVRAEVLEDVLLARRAKRAGVRSARRLGGTLLSARMYDGAGAVLEGFAKNVLAAVSGSRVALVVAVAVNLLAHTAPWILGWWDARWWWIAAGSLALAAGAGAKAGRGVRDAPLQPLAPLALAVIAGTALARRGGYRWKRRSYP